MNSATPNSDAWLNEFDPAGLALLTPDELAHYRQLTEPVPDFVDWTADRLGKHFPVAPSRFHEDLALSLTTLHERRASRECWLAPRGAAKSTWATFAYPLYAASLGLEPYIVLISDTATQARKYLKDIKRELEDWGLHGGVWRDESIELSNGVAIEALGTGDKIRGRRHRGRRPTLIIIDDPQNKDHIVSPLRRERSMEWLTKDVLVAGEPGTNVIVLGTALHREAIVCQLKAGWDTRHYRSIIQWPDRLDLWAEWEKLFQSYDTPDYEERANAYYATNREAMDAGAVALWPERESLYDLMRLRSMDGVAAFASEKQNEPMNPESCEWPASYFEGDELRFLEWPDHTQVELKAVAVDPSKGKDAQAGDYSAIVSVLLDKKGVLWVDADLDRRPVDRIVKDGLDICHQFQPHGFAVEINQFQELLAGEFERQNATRLIPLPLFGITNTQNKVVRLRGLTTWFAQRRVRFRATPGCRVLVDQARDFPAGDHDDGIDALQMAIMLLEYLYNGGVGMDVVPQAMGDVR